MQLKDRAQRGHLLTGVGARKQAVGNTTVATPGSVSRLDTAGVQNKSAGPKNRARNRTQKALLLLALFCGPLCGLLCPVSVVLFSGAVLLSLSAFLRRSLGGFYCAGLSFPLFHGRRPRNRAL